MERMSERAALVTGGTTGLGFSIAQAFVEEGARVVITGRDASIGAPAAATLGDRAHFLQADASNETQVGASVDDAVAWLGGLDVLVNNAGIGVEASTLDTPVADFDKVMAVNVRGPFLYAQASYPHLAERRGCMIHIASDAALLGEADIGVYSVSKAAVVMLSKMLALDGGRDGVRSNCIAPGDIAPGMRHMAAPGEDLGQEDEAEWFIPPVGRIGQASDVAAAAVFFATDESAFCSGSVLLVDGGMRAGARTGIPPAASDES